MASHRTAAARAAVFPLRPSPHAPETFPTAFAGAAAGESSLTRAALYARVSLPYTSTTHFEINT